MLSLILKTFLISFLDFSSWTVYDRKKHFIMLLYVMSHRSTISTKISLALAFTCTHTWWMDEWWEKICVQIIHYTKNNEIGQRGFLDYCSSCVILNGWLQNTNEYFQLWGQVSKTDLARLIQFQMKWVYPNT